MSTMAKPTSKRVELRTFEKWGDHITGHLGHRTAAENGRTVVVHVWCKLCARFRDDLVRHPDTRGVAKTAITQYADGTDSVTKSNCERHITGKTHTLALQLHSLNSSQLVGLYRLLLLITQLLILMQIATLAPTIAVMMTQCLQKVKQRASLIW